MRGILHGGRQNPKLFVHLTDIRVTPKEPLYSVYSFSLFGYRFRVTPVFGDRSEEEAEHGSSPMRGRWSASYAHRTTHILGPAARRPH